MTVRKKIDNDLQEKIISKGGEVASDKRSKEWTTICLRIPKDILKEVDERVDLRPSLNRTAWIMEAIQEKLKKEKRDD